MANGIDCATPLTLKTARALYAEGYRFACRYLVPPAYAWKRLTLSEAQAITEAGLQIVSVFETAAKRAAGAAEAGRADGAAAYQEALAIGQPFGTAIYFAVDYEAGPGDYDRIEAYLRAAGAEIRGYSLGVYGSYAVIEEMAKRGVCRHYWQTYAWSRGKKSPKINLYQYRNHIQAAGILVDLNESYGNEGWWNTNMTGHIGGAGSMMSKEDAEKIIRFLQAAWQIATTKTDKDEFHRLANEIRKAAGIPVDD